MFSVNTNLGALAALQSLAATQTDLTTTQARISTGKRVTNASDNPAVYAISQAMNSTISGLSAVSDNLSFGAQVVKTSSDSAASISTALNTLKATLTSSQQQGLSQAQMNNSITAALQQIDSFANSATMNGVNLISGATGNGVSDTQLNVLTDARGSSFVVGGTGAQALNATSAGLGIAKLNASSTASQISFGSDSALSSSGLKLVANGAVLGGATGAAATSTNLVVQTANFATGGTAQNVAQKTYVVLNDGSTNGTNDILNQLNAAVNAATAGATGTTTSGSGTAVAVGAAIDIKTGGDPANAGEAAAFSLPTGSAPPVAGSTLIVASSDPLQVGQYTKYTFGAGYTADPTVNGDGTTTYNVSSGAGTVTAQNYINVGAQVTTPAVVPSATEFTISSGAVLPGGDVTGAYSAGFPPATNDTFTVGANDVNITMASQDPNSPGGIVQYKLKAGDVYTATVNTNGTTTWANDGTNPIVTTFYAAATSATSTAVASFQNSSSASALGGSSALAVNATFTLAAGAAAPVITSAGGTLDVASMDPEKVGQFTHYTFAATTQLSGVQNTDGTTTYTVRNTAGTQQTFFNSSANEGAATTISSITLATGLAPPTNGAYFSMASSSNAGDTTLYHFTGAVTGTTNNNDGTTTYAIAGSKQDFKPSTSAGTDFTLDSKTGAISLTAGGKNGSITDLGNGTTQYSYVTARDANGNATSQVNVISANVKSLGYPSTSGSLTSALDGTLGTNSAAAQATRTAAVGTLVSALTAAGFNSSVDAKNNLTIAGNNLDTTGAPGNASATAKVMNFQAAGATSESTAYGVQQTGAAAAISNVDAAIAKLGSISSALGTAAQHITGMQSFTSTLSQALTAGVGALTDADLATESAKLQSLQTKQQLGIQALSIANQQPQALLKLFG
jgi:flagellin